MADATASPESVIQQKKSRTVIDNATTVFPSDLYPGKSMCLFFYDYEKPEQGEPGNFSPSKSIFLPLPGNLVDSLALSYRDVELGSLGGELYNVIATIGDEFRKVKLGDAESVASSLTTVYESAKSAAGSPGSLQALVRRQLSSMGSMGEFVGRAVDITTKSIPNPHLTTLFGGVGLRTHSFSWKLTPRSVEETKTIKEIIRQIKFNSLPSKEGNYLLGFPQIVKVFIFINGSEYQELFKIKPSVIESVDVNYSSAGAPVFFADTGGPVEVELSIKLKELQIFTKEDITWSDNGTVTSVYMEN